MPKILALDTSTDACSVALYVDGEVAEDFRIIPRQHTQQLLPMVEALLAEAELSVSALDAIAFGRGPGSFAGIRIATGAAQGLAFAADLPMLPVSTLETMALQAFQKTGAEHVVAALDARMDEIYVAAYSYEEKSVVSLMPEQVCAPSALQLPAGVQYIAVGSGWRYLEDMSNETQAALQVVGDEYYPSAKGMLSLALLQWQNGVLTPAEEALPVYLRDEVAWKKKDQQ